MNGETIDAGMLAGIIQELEETVERANLLALELALKTLDEEDAIGACPEEVAGVEHLANRAVCATGEIERLVRRLKAA